jgi:hypothetical protein
MAQECNKILLQYKNTELENLKLFNNSTDLKT